ncbi:hypothetical protein C8R44DRAFT_948514 [Mycena epipterygia]|nr:hypothetical protein C8R44DRAFT_948514 [Mycena epipterygia]
MSNVAPILSGIDQHFYDANLGPFLSGLAAQMFMMGVLTLQMWKYFEDHGKDPWTIKALVITMFCASTLQFATDLLLEPLWLDSDAIPLVMSPHGRQVVSTTRTSDMSLLDLWTPQAFIAAMAQGFFLHRCWQLTRLPTVLIVGGLGMGVSFGSGIAASVGLAARPYYTETPTIVIPVTAWLIALDICTKRKRGSKNLDVLIYRELQEKTLSKIVRITFETAGIFPHSSLRPRLILVSSALTSLIALADLIVYLISAKQNSAHLAFQLVIGKTYNHSIMVTLLSRTRIRSDFDSSGGRGATDSGGNKGMPNPGITVTRTQIRVTDHVGYPMKSLTPTEAEVEESEINGSSDKIPQIVV